VDCEGTFSACTTACELAGDRTFTQTRAKSGNGLACPTAEDCKPEDGACVDKVAECCNEWSADCYSKRGHHNNWHTCQECRAPALDPCASSCSAFGKTATSEECRNCCISFDHETPWNCPENMASTTQTTLTTTTSAATTSPAATTDPVIEAPTDLDCEGTFSPCSAACEIKSERVWTETQAKSGNGADCPAAEDCQDGVGECLDCYDIKPPDWWKYPTCTLQDSSGKCGIRVQQDSIYCRKTCGLCGDRESATLHPTSSPTNVPTAACHDIQPPPWWEYNSCSLQQSNGKCIKRKGTKSKFCRKTCGLCK